ncbi:MAG: LysR substrate-binding domain-containing protein [Gammaproteobacteria bacterium]|nr:LysR substrate-binding domain-containing protein [Gammaproteobacteria bacterium]MDH5514453.1 LysR substrate-binding domain-containing protein [Gammaproteobacteria bacterium]
MTLTELRYIVAVSHEKHFGRAARACHVSQPTLSIAIKKLEEELGVQLFERKASEITVTPVGERIIEQAQRTLEAADGVRLAAREGKDQLAGPVRIGAIYTIGPYLFPDLIPRLRKHAPDMPLVIEENFTAVLAEKLKQGELDVIIISLPFKEQGILTLPLYDEPFVVLLPAAHPLTQRKFINSKQLENEPVLLLGAGHCFRDQVLEACPACLPKPGLEGDLSNTVVGSSLETIRHMVVSGLGITILPCTATGADRYSQRLLAVRRFTRPIPTRTVALAWRISYPRPKVIDAIGQSVAECGFTCVKPVRRKRV